MRSFVLTFFCHLAAYSKIFEQLQSCFLGTLLVAGVNKLQLIKENEFDFLNFKINF